MQTPKQNPFLGLKPYEWGDRERLYGRDKDLFLMMDRICSARTTLLFAGSGVGKTSFINAKIIPELEDQQYCVIYHNEWAQEPLDALRKSLTAILSPNGETSPTSIGSKSLLEHLAEFTKTTAEDSPNTPVKLGAIILDQFEEIFQYHSHKTYFRKFIDEIAEVINSDKCNARILFAMREEFLGELSVFDNKIPDLFSNYYRLKCPNKQEAANIIRNTAEVPVNIENLKTLVNDLAKDERGERVLGDALAAGSTSWERDMVEPPYLQIACQGLWDQQFSSANRDKSQNGNGGESYFLSDYQTGQAHEMLRKFLAEHLSSFKKPERALLADAFDYLVTKKGAKMAYELSNLAELMEVKEGALKPILIKLSEARILRKSIGQDRSPWFELYHDRYASIIDDWKRSYRVAEKAQGKIERKAEVRRVVKTAAALALVLALFAASVLAFASFVTLPRRYRATLANANLRDQAQYVKAQEAFVKLRATPGRDQQAARLWSEAWKRRAQVAEREERRDEALLSWLKAANEGPPQGESPAIFQQINSYLNADDYQRLLVTFPTDIRTPNFFKTFSADGKRLIAATNDLRVLQWDTDSGRLLEQSPPLELDTRNLEGAQQLNDPTRTGEPSNLPPTGGPMGFSADAQILAAAGDFVGGLDKGKLSVWRLKTGTKVFRTPKKNSQTGAGNAVPSDMAYLQPSVSFSPDGLYFATLEPQGSVQVYDQAQQPVELDSLPASPASSVVFSPDNKTLLVLFDKDILQVHDLKKNHTLIRTQPIDSRSIRRITFSPDGLNFLTEAVLDHSAANEGPATHLHPYGSTVSAQEAEAHANAKIWEVTGGKEKEVGAIDDVVGSLDFCADNKTIAVSNVSNSESILTIKFVNFKGTSAGSDLTVYEDVNGYRVNPDGKSILTLRDPAIARLWKLAPPKRREKIITPSSPIEKYEVSANGQVVATAHQDETIRIWNTNTLSETHSFKVRAGSEQGSSLSFTPGGVQLTVSSQGRYVCLSGSMPFTVRDIEGNREILPERFVKEDVTYPVSFTANDETLAVTTPRNIIVFNLRGETEIGKIALTENKPVDAIVFSPDNKYLAVSLPETVKVFEVATCMEVKQPNPKSIGLSLIAFGGNGKAIASEWLRDDGVLLWDLSTGQVKQLSHDAVTAFALSPDGTRALTSASDGSLKLWDATNGTQIGEAEKYNSKTRGVTISDNGQTATVFSEEWIHVTSLTNNGPKHQYGRLIGPMSHGTPQFLDATGKHLRRILYSLPNSLEIEDIDFRTQANAKVGGEAAMGLFEKWKSKLFLDFDKKSGELSRLPIELP